MKTSAGKVVTPALVERMIEDAAAGFPGAKRRWVTNAHRVTPGRTRVTAPGRLRDKTSVQRLSVSVNPDLTARLRAEARRRGVPLATVMRERLAARA